MDKSYKFYSEDGNYIFSINWNDWYKMVSDYEDSTIELIDKTRGKLEINWFRILNFEELANFLVDTFKDLLQPGVNLYIDSNFFKNYFKNFMVKSKLIEYDNGIEIAPDFTYDSLQTSNFDINDLLRKED